MRESLGEAITGFSALLSKFESLKNGMRTEAENTLEIIALDLKGKAQDLAPVDTGDLKGSAFHEVKDLEATIGFKEPYAMRQHEEVGFRHPKGGQAKFLEQPLKENAMMYVNHFTETIKRLIGGR